jgi:hypothetical protein
MTERGDIQLNRFWNELVQVGDALADDLDPGSADLIRRMHALANAPLPVSARERVWRGLLDTYAPISEETETPMFIATDQIRPASPVNGHAPRVRLLALPEDRSRWLGRPFAYLAVAALLLALLSAAAAIRFTSWGDAPGPSKGGPAVFAPAPPSPAAESTDMTLVETNLPAGSFSIGGPDGVGVAFVLATVPPNTRGSWSPAADDCRCGGARLISVIDGSIGITADGAIQVFRGDGDGSAEEIASGSEASLDAGDTVIFASDISYEATNSQVTPARVFYWMRSGLTLLHDNTTWPDTWQVTETYDTSGVGGPVDPALAGTVTLRLRRVTLATDETSEPLLIGTWNLITDPERSQYGTNSDGSIKNITATPVTYYVITLEPATATATPDS